MIDWIKWDGGDCPVPIGTIVDIKHRDGREYFNESAGMPGSHCENWSHDEDFENIFSGDIIAYRVSKNEDRNCFEIETNFQISIIWGGSGVTAERVSDGIKYIAHSNYACFKDYASARIDAVNKLVIKLRHDGVV